MTGVIKHTEDGDHIDFTNAKVAWLKTKTNLKIKSGQKIIKADDLAHADMDKEIPNVNSRFGDFQVITLQNGDVINGIEVTCRCGAKIEIHFDYSENDTDETADGE